MPHNHIVNGTRTSRQSDPEYTKFVEQVDLAAMLSPITSLRGGSISCRLAAELLSVYPMTRPDNGRKLDKIQSAYQVARRALGMPEAQTRQIERALAKGYKAAREALELATATLKSARSTVKLEVLAELAERTLSENRMAPQVDEIFEKQVTTAEESKEERAIRLDAELTKKLNKAGIRSRH